MKFNFIIDKSPQFFLIMLSKLFDCNCQCIKIKDDY